MLMFRVYAGRRCGRISTCCRRVALCALVAACGSACAPSPGALLVITGPVGAAQLADARALVERTGVAWSVRFHEDIGTPAFVSGRLAGAIARVEQAPAAAHGFVVLHRALFRLAGTGEDLVAQAPQEDELGMIHVRLVQRQDQIAIRGGGLTVHFDRQGALVRVHGRYWPVPRVSLIPVVDRDRARAQALAYVQTRHPELPSERFTLLEPKLLLDPQRDAGAVVAVRLAWSVDLFVDDRGAPARLLLLVDAASGIVYSSEEALDTLAGSGRGVLGEAHDLVITQAGDRYFLENEHAGSPPQRTYQAQPEAKLPGQLTSSDRADQWDAAGPAAGAAVSAHAFVTFATTYFATAYGRRGALDDTSGMRATVHYGSGVMDAFWNGRQLVFGDGPGAAAAAIPFVAALDVVAHEFSHAVIESAAGLGHQGQSGTLNEALADIFACFIEHAARREEADWRIGEVLFPAEAGRAVRDLASPWTLGQPAHLDDHVRTDLDRGGIHVNATIIGHAAYLMSMGGVHPRSGIHVMGLGVPAVERIFYRALTRYLRPQADYRDIVDATHAAAVDLAGSPSLALDTVSAAWRAVGLLPVQ